MDNELANLESKPNSDHLIISEFDSFLIKYIRYFELSVALLVLTGLVSLFCVEAYFYDNHSEDYKSEKSTKLEQANEASLFDISKGIAPDTINSAIKNKAFGS